MNGELYSTAFVVLFFCGKSSPSFKVVFPRTELHILSTLIYKKKNNFTHTVILYTMMPLVAVTSASILRIEMYSIDEGK